MISIADFFAVVVYGIVTTTLGALFVRKFCKEKSLQDGAVYYLSGQLIWLCVFLVCAILGISVSGVVWMIGVASVPFATVFIWKGRDSVGSVAMTALVLGIIAVVCFPQVIYSMTKIPLSGWDARSIWFFHAKAIWFDGGVSRHFFANSNFVWSHTDYPLLLPVQGAVVCFLRGEWSEMTAKAILFLNFVAYLHLLHRVLIMRGWHSLSAWALSLAVMQVAALAYVDGYADNHYAMPLMLAAMLIFQERGCGLSLAVLLATFAINIKNEAIFYVVAGVPISLIYMWQRRPMLPDIDAEGRRSFFVALPGIVAYVLWGYYKFILDIHGDLHLASRLFAPIQSLQLIWHRLPLIFEYVFQSPRAVHLGELLGICFLLAIWHSLSSARAKRSAFSVADILLWIYFSMVCGMIVTVYGITPYNLQWHLATSLERLLFFPLLLIITLVISLLEGVTLDEMSEL